MKEKNVFVVTAWLDNSYSTYNIEHRKCVKRRMKWNGNKEKTKDY